LESKSEPSRVVVTALRRWSLLLLLVAPTLLYGQAPEQKPRAFEVASVKPAKLTPSFRTGFFCSTPSRERFRGFGRLRFFIACAYDIPPARGQHEIVDGPTWIDDDLFEIDAKTTSGYKLSSASHCDAAFPTSESPV